MGQLSHADVHIDKALTDYAFGVLQDPAAHVAGSFFPIQEVDNISGKYYVLNRNAFLRGDAKARGFNMESTGHTFEISTDSFSCQEFADHADVPWQLLRNADNEQMLREAAVRVAMQNVLLTFELAFAAEFFATGIWGVDYTGVASGPTGNQFLQWNDAASDPEADVDRGSRAILVNGGRPANALLIGYDAWLALKRHPKIVDRIKHTSKEPVTQDLVANLFGLEKVVVTLATKATNAVGQTETYDFVYGKAALLAYVGGMNEGEFMPSAGRVFAWKGVNPGALRSNSLAVAEIEKPLHKATRFEAEAAWDFKVTGPKLGAFFASAVA